MCVPNHGRLPVSKIRSTQGNRDRDTESWQRMYLPIEDYINCFESCQTRRNETPKSKLAGWWCETGISDAQPSVQREPPAPGNKHAYVYTSRAANNWTPEVSCHNHHFIYHTANDILPRLYPVDLRLKVSISLFERDHSLKVTLGERHWLDALFKILSGVNVLVIQSQGDASLYDKVCKWRDKNMLRAQA